jgi:hypothetical protein
MRMVLLVALVACREHADPVEQSVTVHEVAPPKRPVPAHVTDALVAAKEVAKLAGPRCGELFAQLEAGYCFQGHGDSAKAIDLGPNALASKPGVLYYDVECERVQPDAHGSMSCLFRPPGDYDKFHPDATYTVAPGSDDFNFNLIPPETGAGILVGRSKDAFPYRVHVAAKLTDRDYVQVDAVVAAMPTPR